MGARSRRKGSAFELRVAKALSTWSGETFRRTPLSGGWDRQRAPGDIQGPPWWRWPIECKDRKGWTWETTLRGAGPVWEWWSEAKELHGILVLHGPRTADWLMLPRRLALLLAMAHGPAILGRAKLAAPADPTADPEDIDYRVAHLYGLHDVLTATDPVWWRTVGDS